MKTSHPVLLMAMVALAIVTALQPSMGQSMDAARPAYVPKYGVFEAALKWEGASENPFSDVKMHGSFAKPGAGLPVLVEGFYCGESEWRVRFMPQQQGQWPYSIVLTGPDGTVATKSGEFVCKGQVGHGPVRISRRNRFRFEHADGTPFYPIGLQTCGYF